jgi:hypothetical protein
MPRKSHWRFQMAMLAGFRNDRFKHQTCARQIESSPRRALPDHLLSNQCT